MTEAVVRVLICDDHAVFRRGLAIVLGDEDGVALVGEAADTDDAVAQAVALHPDVILLDLRMPGGGGLVALERIADAVPAARVLVLTVSDDDDDLFAAVAAGAAGYLLKEVSVEEVGDAVRRAAAGERLLSPAMTAKLLGGFAALANGRPAGSATDPRSSTEPAASAVTSGAGRVSDAGLAGPGAGLTARERQVLDGLARGLSNRALAADLGIAENTVKNHVRAVLDKLGVSSRTEAATLALRLGLL